MFKKLNLGAQLILIFSVPALVALTIIGINELDPYYKTTKNIPAEVIRRVHKTGKAGARIQIIIKTDEGKKYSFIRTHYQKYAGDKVRLRIYERKITGFQKYELEP